MLYHFLYPLSQDYPFFNVFKYITTRSFIAFTLGVLFSIYLGRKFIIFMKMKQFGQAIREVGPESHKKKGGTPTMGGIFIFAAVILSMIVCGNFTSTSLNATLAVFASYFVLGFLDDYYKILKKNSDGVSARMKLVWQFGTAGIISFYLVQWGGMDTLLHVPFYKYPVIDLGWFYVIFSSFVIVGASNAVNLTDGLDGLAIGPIMTSLLTLAIFCYISGHLEIANYLFYPHIHNLGELTVLASAIIGAGVGFLWYNAYPAQVFMGDVGALSLGGVIGVMSVVSKNEILSLIFGGIFVVEALSVILQVTSFKTRKKRIFRMAPIHHHFELGGWEEPKVIVRFWVVALVLAILSIATIKLR
jgi:phospho-N-acetylmuramoyl-pentapeptide-transferase